MLLTKHIQVCTGRVCRTMLTECAGDKHTQVSIRRVCHTTLTEYVGDKAQVIQVSTRRVCRTMLTEYVGKKAHTAAGFYAQCFSYNTDRACW